MAFNLLTSSSDWVNSLRESSNIVYTENERDFYLRDSSTSTDLVHPVWHAGLFDCRNTLFHTRRYCWFHHSHGSCQRLRPSRRHNKGRVAHQLICSWYSQNLQGASKRGRERYKHIVAMVPVVWKNSRVSMTLPRRLGWLDETSQASWCICPLLFFFFCIFQLFFLSFAHPELPPKLLFRPVLSFLLLYFVQMRCYFPFFHQSDRPSPPTPLHISLWELTGLCKEHFV